MNKFTERLIQAYVVLHYYHLIDEAKGKCLSEIPENIRDEVEIKANERYINEYESKVGKIE